MSNRDHLPEEESNQQRLAAQEAERDPLPAVPIGKVAEAIVEPLGQDQDDFEEARRQDVANDAEQRLVQRREDDVPSGWTSRRFTSTTWRTRERLHDGMCPALRPAAHGTGGGPCRPS
jgi:hypothetical protein